MSRDSVSCQESIVIIEYDPTPALRGSLICLGTRNHLACQVMTMGCRKKSGSIEHCVYGTGIGFPRFSDCVTEYLG